MPGSEQPLRGMENPERRGCADGERAFLPSPFLLGAAPMDEPKSPRPVGARRERHARVSLAAGGTAFLFPFLSGGVSSPDPHLHSEAGGGLGALEASSTALCRHDERLDFNIHNTRESAEVPGLLVLFC